MKKITGSQFVAMLVITRAFLSVTYGITENHINVGLSMLSIAVSIVVECALIIPPLAFANIYPNKDFIQVAFKKSKGLGWVLSVAYGCFFVFEASRQMGIFSYFLKIEFLEFLPSPILIIALGCVGLYGASLGIKPLSRSSFVGAFIFVIMFLVIIFGVTGEYDIYNIQLATPYPENTFRAFTKDVFDRIGRSDEIVALPFLLKFSQRNSAKVTYGYMGLKVFLMEIMVFYSALILGEYANTLSMPFYTLSTYAKTSVIERYDSIYMWVWTITAVIKVGILMYLGSVCLNHLTIFDKKISVLSTGLISIGLSAFLSFRKAYDSVFFQAPSTVVVILLSCIFPLGILIIEKRSEILRKDC